MVKFMYNWNGKLDTEYYTTIRPEAYGYRVGPNQVQDHLGNLRDVEILLRIPMEIWKLPGYLLYLDAGMDRAAFLDLMRRFYGKKPWWKEEDTMVVILLIHDLTFVTRQKTTWICGACHQEMRREEVYTHSCDALMLYQTADKIEKGEKEGSDGS